MKNEKLFTLLSAYYVLECKYRNYHWNVECHHFTEYHSFFEKSYDTIAEEIDEIAEGVEVGTAVQVGRIAETGVGVHVDVHVHPAVGIGADEGEDGLDDEDEGGRQGDAPQDFHDRAEFSPPACNHR